MNTTACNNVQHGGRAHRSSRIKRGLVAAVGAAALASGALAFSAAPAMAATPSAVAIHTEHLDALQCYGFWDGCELSAAQV